MAQMISISRSIEPIFNTEWKGTLLHGRCKVDDFTRKLWRIIYCVDNLDLQNSGLL